MRLGVRVRKSAGRGGASPLGLSRRWALIAGGVVVALVLAAWSVSLWRSAHGTDDSYAIERDTVMAAAKRHVATLNSIDAANPDTGLRTWLDASTGALRDELTRTQAANKQKAIKTRSTARSTVVAAAVTALDRRAGNATVLTSVEVTVNVSGSATTQQRKRFSADLQRTPSGWKVKSLTAIGVNAR